MNKQCSKSDLWMTFYGPLSMGLGGYNNVNFLQDTPNRTTHPQEHSWLSPSVSVFCAYKYDFLSLAVAELYVIRCYNRLHKGETLMCN